MGFVIDVVGERIPYQSDRFLARKRDDPRYTLMTSSVGGPVQSGAQVGPERDVVGSDANFLEIVFDQIEIPRPNDSLLHS